MSFDSAFASLDVAAAKYESRDAPDLVTDFYRREMRVYGNVVECQGDVDFDAPSPGRVTCRRNPEASRLQLVVGGEENHRLVSVQRRGSGTKFSVVYVRARDRQ